jgi:gliding motility-associated-like protein
VLVLQPDFSLDGRYVLKVTTDEGCAVSDEIDIQRPVITDMFADTLSACKAGDTLTIFPGYASAATFTWDDGSTDRARRVTEPGTYSVTVTEACITHTETIVVVYDEPFTYSVRTLPENPCIGDTVTIEVTTNAYAPRYNFRSLPEGAMLPSKNGSLTVVAGEQTDILAFIGNGCETVMDTIRINASTPIAVAEPVVAHIVCGSNSGTIQITLPQSEDIRVDWYDPQGRFIQSGGTRLSVDTPGQYSIHLSDGVHCDQRLRATVKEASGIAATFTTTNVSCDQFGKISITELTGTAPFDIVWSKEGRKLSALSGRQTLTGLSPGTYRARLTDATGCTAAYDLEVAPYTPMTVSASASYADCTDPNSGSISIAVSGGVGPFTYQLGDDAPQSTADYGDLAAGIYTITVRDSFGCTPLIETVTLAPPLATAPRSPTSKLHHIRLGESVVLGNGNGEVVPPPGKVSWAPTRGLSCTDCMAPAAAPTETTRYTVTYSNGSGCSSSELVTVIVDERVDVYVPNAFSPNGDSNNDRFRAFPGRGVVAVTDLRVYDRWGELIWVQENAEEGWDGTYRGRTLNAAVFAYTGTVLLANGDQQQFTGSVTLVD